MSTPQPASGTVPASKDKPKRNSLQRFVSKIIKTGKQSKKSETPTVAESSSSAAPATTPVAPVETPVVETINPKEPVAEVKESAPVEKTTESETPITSTPLTPAQRAKILAQKHGVEISDDWPFPARPTPGERVEKPIRMRVRRYCHLCQTAFGSENTCPSCNHKKCSDCPRTPMKSEKKKTKTKHKEYDIYAGLKMPSKTGGQDLIHRDIRRRVHWKCHECKADFAGEKVCKGCSHSRCDSCIRDPPKKEKTVPEHPVKRPTRWTCSQCQSAHNKTKTCAKCGHVRTKADVREAPRKKKKKAVASAPTSDTETKEPTISQSIIDKVSSVLASTSIKA